MHKSRVVISVFLFLFLAVIISAEEKTLQEKQRETILYGTDAEILNLCQQLEADKLFYLDNDLMTVLENTHNSKIMVAILDSFGKRKVEIAESRAIRAIEERDLEKNEAIRSAISYLGAIRSKNASAVLRKLIEDKEATFISDAINSLGKCGTESDVDYLITYAKGLDSEDQLHFQILQALGEIKSKKATDYLLELSDNTELSPSKLIYIVNAMSKIGDEKALGALLKALENDDANVRAATIAALGPFSGDKADSAIIEAFRDSFYKTRIAAAKAAAERKLEKAVPYLEYRANRDDVLAVREEAVRSLGVIGSGESLKAVHALFNDKRIPESLILVSAKVLLEKDTSDSVVPVILMLDEAQKAKRKDLYNGLAKVLTETKSPKLEDLARRFLASKDIIDKHFGLDLVIMNGFTGFDDVLNQLAADKSESLSRKAKKALGK